jgi:hypothetical protein
VTFDEAVEQLVALARRSGGRITAMEVESDPTLASDREIVSAAARKLDGSTNIFGTPQPPSSGGWFPFAELHFTELPDADSERR